MYFKAWFPYDRFDRPSRLGRLKLCSGDSNNYMETLCGRLRTIANDPGDPDDRDRLDRNEFYPDDQDDPKRS